MVYLLVVAMSGVRIRLHGIDIILSLVPTLFPQWHPISAIWEINSISEQSDTCTDTPVLGSTRRTGFSTAESAIKFSLLPCGEYITTVTSSLWSAVMHINFNRSIISPRHHGIDLDHQTRTVISKLPSNKIVTGVRLWRCHMRHRRPSSNEKNKFQSSVPRLYADLAIPHQHLQSRWANHRGYLSPLNQKRPNHP